MYARPLNANPTPDAASIQRTRRGVKVALRRWGNSCVMNKHGNT